MITNTMDLAGAGCHSSNINVFHFGDTRFKLEPAVLRFVMVFLCPSRKVASYRTSKQVTPTLPIHHSIT